MLQNTCFSNIPAACRTGLYRCSLLAALVGLTTLCEPALNAATNVAYLQQPTQQQGRTFSYPIPACGGTPLHAGTWGPFNLPGYGNSVWVTLSPASPSSFGQIGQVPDLTWCNKFPFQQTDNTLYTWGADSNVLNLKNNTSSILTYTLTFNFDGPRPPDPADLFLVIEGMGCFEEGCTLAQIANEVPAPTSPPGNNVGEYTNQQSYAQTYYQTNYTGPWGVQGVPSFSPNAFYRPQVSVSGWDLYQPNVTGLAQLQIQVSQIPGDNIGFTLGYKTGCSGLVGLAGVAGAANTPSTLYDINTTSGAATNPLQAGFDWGIAFSSDWSSVPVLVYNTLSTINLETGQNGSQTALPGTFYAPSGTGGGLAADLTGNLYAIDPLGNLVEINAGGSRQSLGSAGASAASWYSKPGNFVPAPLTCPALSCRFLRAWPSLRGICGASTLVTATYWN